MGKSKVKVELLWNELLKEPDVEEYLGGIVEGIAGRCGDGYECKTKMMSTRWVGIVYADTKEAKQDNNRNNTILKNLRG